MNAFKDDESLREVLDQAAELSGDSRDEYLAGACHDDTELRTRVMELLEALDVADQFLVDPTIDAAPVERSRAGSRPLHGSKIDKYELLGSIGEGGMGTVYHARQHWPVRREVALKVIKLGMDTRRVIGRFDAERQALAMMDHPSIAKVLDAGATEAGRPFFVMELVRGVRITDYCDQNLLSIGERLELFIHVCNAVQHAHQKGIIHRDLKPSNVLVTMQDMEPVPKIIDFGIAKATSEQPGGDDPTQFTEMSQLLGTPMYMSPEQVENGGVNIDTRIDVYALGVMLYELLTGKTPFDKARLRDASREELTKIICHEVPPRPSVRVTPAAKENEEGAKLRGTESRALTGMLRGDLDWIVMRCLEKDRARRYDTANALARDIDRHLNDQPVEASPPSTAYLLTKFVHRHRPALAASFAFVLLLIGATGFSVRQAVRATHAEANTAHEKELGDQHARDAIKELEHAVKAQEIIKEIILKAQPTAGSTGRDVSVVELLRSASGSVGTYLDAHPESQIQVRVELADAFENLNELDYAKENLQAAYKLTCALPGGDRSREAVRLAARLAMHMDLPFAERAYEDAKKRFGPNDPVTQCAGSGLAHVLGERALSGIFRIDELRRGEDIMAGIVKQIDAMPANQMTPACYQHMNQLAVLLTIGHEYPEAEAVVRRALERGSHEGHLREGNRASLGFILVEALRGQSKTGEALEWARQTYEFDRATIGAFNPRTDRMLRTYIKLLGMTGKTTDANRILHETLGMARSFYPGDNKTVADFLATLAQYLMDQGDAESAIPQLIESARPQLNLLDSNGDKARLTAREALFASLGCKQQARDGGIRAQVFSALEDMWRDHPDRMPPSLKLAPQEVGYRVSNWSEDKALLEGTLADAGPSGPGPGLYRLTVETRSPEQGVFSQTFGILIAGWDTILYEDDETQPLDLTRSFATPTTQPIEHRTLPAIATTHLFKDTPETFSPFLRTCGSTTLHLPAGRYRFTTSSVDGIRLYVDGRVAISAWSAHRPRRDIRELELDEGPHDLKFDSFQKGRRRLIWIRVEPLIESATIPPLRTLARALKEQTEMKCPEANATTATLMAHAGKFQLAREEYARAIALESTEPFWWQQTALVDLEMGDVAGYRAAVARFFQNEAREGDRMGAARAAMVALMGGDGNVAPEIRTRLRIIDANTAPPSQRAECQMAQGLAEFRAGQYAECARLLGEAVSGRLTPEAKTAAGIFRAMALQRAGEIDKARAELESARKAMARFPAAEKSELDSMEVQDRLICELAAKEAQVQFGKEFQ